MRAPDWAFIFTWHAALFHRAAQLVKLSAVCAELKLKALLVLRTIFGLPIQPVDLR